MRLFRSLPSGELAAIKTKFVELAQNALHNIPEFSELRVVYAWRRTFVYKLVSQAIVMLDLLPGRVRKALLPG